MSWNQLPAELNFLADELNKERETELTAQALKDLHKVFRHDWQTSSHIETPSGGVPIPPPRDQALHPVGCEISEAFVYFQFHLGDEKLQFPSRADFQVRVLGYLNLPNSLVELEDHWRVDTDIFARPKAKESEKLKGPDENKPKPPKEPHPLFHFQRGGHAQNNFAQKLGFVPGQDLPGRPAEVWRGLLQSPGPRVPIPPMCPVLAIDFAIGQHDGRVWRRLRNKPEYLNIIRKAQARLWEPFFQALSDAKSRRELIGPLVI